MAADESVTQWIRGIRPGAPKDARNRAAHNLYERYFERLVRLAHRHLCGVPLRDASAEDVAAHAFATFCRRLEVGQFAQLHARDDLGRLLARIIGHKAIKLRLYHAAAK